MRFAAAALALGASFVALGGCAHLPNGSVPSPTPTPSATSTPTPAPCTQTAAPNAKLVVVSPLITPTTDPTYGVIGGYGLVTNGNSSNVAAIVNVPSGATVQFFNNDQFISQLRYSAVGIPGVSAFPSPTYTFPPSSVTQIGTQITSTSTWSTGLLAGQCYSPSFSVAGPGAYFFGDYNYYGLANIRDVIVVASPVP